jgi:glycosyltransferase involved in cell wall biosynthesis
MALGIPAVASPVGVNQSIIENQKNGFLCSNNNEWYQALTALIANSGMREQMGSLGREKIISSYSVLANSACFLRLFT